MGIRLQGINRAIIESFERTSDTAKGMLEDLDRISEAADHVCRLEENNTRRIRISIGAGCDRHAFACDGEFLGEFHEALTGLYLRKQRELEGFEWEIPLVVEGMDGKLERGAGDDQIDLDIY